jgi:5-methylcytosine-specific restriction endonuclease McrA
MAANKDRMAIYFREWNEKNKAKRVKYSQEWKKRHPEFKPDPEKVRGWYAKYRRNNRDKTRAAIARWAKNNLHKRCASAARRRARMGDGSFRKNEQIDRIYARAQWWRKWFDVVVDHVIPLAKGGTHTADNLQIIYAFENTKKHARLDYKPRIVFL